MGGPDTRHVRTGSMPSLGVVAPNSPAKVSTSSLIDMSTGLNNRRGVAINSAMSNPPSRRNSSAKPATTRVNAPGPTQLPSNAIQMPTSPTWRRPKTTLGALWRRMRLDERRKPTPLASCLRPWGVASLM